MEREGRRRKIMSRGSDRMALITGRINSLDPDNDNHGGNYMPDTPTKHENEEEISEPNPSETKLPNLHNLEVKKLPKPSPIPDFNNQEQSSQITPRISKIKPNNPNLDKKPFGYFLKSLTPKEINTSIVSSENTRVVCSVVVAILVVLSHVNLPHNVVKSKSLIAYRPLYVVLLTDVLIVAARLALCTQTREEANKEQSVDHKDGDNWGEAIKLLEFGLVLHQTLRAVFIDCSFYLVIVVCGFSLV